MVADNTSVMNTPFYVSVDYVKGTSTGISAMDRAKTIQAIVDPKTNPADMAKRVDIFPLCAHKGGVLARAGHTEAVVDLCRLSGLNSAGVLCEIMKEDGTMARLPELVKGFCSKISIKNL